MVVATQAKGTVLIHQKMFESRLFFVDKLIDMGAQIILCDPHRANVIGLDHHHALRGIRDPWREHPPRELRRDLSSEQVAERAGISRNTLIKIERGDEGVCIRMYFRVLIVLGLQDDLLLLIARDDVLGRKFAGHQPGHTAPCLEKATLERLTP